MSKAIDASLNGHTYVLTSNADPYAGSSVMTIKVAWIDNGKRRTKRVQHDPEYYGTDPRAHVIAIKRVLGVDVLEPHVHASSHAYTWQVAL